MSFRTMYDGITPADLPHDGALYASYVDGRWPHFPALHSLFPGKRYVSIAVDPAHVAQVLDVEQFDARPDQAPGWAANMRRRRIVPTVYCSESLWPEVIAAFHAQGVASPLWWIANYARNGSALPVGAIALQYQSTPGYDRSIVAAYWPGVDPAPARPGPSSGGHKPIPRQRHIVAAGENLSTIAAGWHVPLSAVEHANPHAGHPAGNFDNVWPGDVIYHP